MDVINLPQYGISVKYKPYGFYIPELKTLFEATTNPDFDPEVILITHTHTRQCYSLPQKLSHKTTIYIPTETQQSISSFIKAKYYQCNVIHEVVGVSTDQIFQLKNHIHCKAYSLDHTIPCLGYGIVAIKEVLKKEYVTMNRRQVIQLKRTGTQLTETQTDPLFVFLPETPVTVFDQYSDLFSYPYIIIECSFFPIDVNCLENDLFMAKEKKILHWNSLEPVIKTHPETTFIVTPSSDTSGFKSFTNNIELPNVIWVTK